MPVALVSGGRGHVGSFIVEGLIRAGHEVIVAGRAPPAGGTFSQPVRFAPLTLDAEHVDGRLFDGVDIFIHAAFDHVPGRYRGGEGDDAEGFVRRNRDGSVALFEAARTSGVRHVVFLSSRAVYGTQPPGAMLSENTPANPNTLYGEVKLGAEKALLTLADPAMAATVLRVTGVYGRPPGRVEDKWSAMIHRFLAGEAIDPRAATEVHGADVAAAVRLVLDRGAGVPPVLNVSDIVVDRHDLLATVNEAAGTSWPLPPRSDAAVLNVMDTTALRGIGWQPGGRGLFEATVRSATREALAAAGQ